MLYILTKIIKIYIKSTCIAKILIKDKQIHWKMKGEATANHPTRGSALASWPDAVRHPEKQSPT